MKIRLLIALFVALPLFNTLGQSLTRGSIAFARYDQVYSNYFKVRLANAQLENLRETMNRERTLLVVQFDRLQADVTALRQRLRADDLDDETRSAARKEIDEKLIELRRTEERIKNFTETQGRRTEIQERRVKGELMAEIRTKITEHARERGYLAIIDTSLRAGHDEPPVIYLDPRADITAVLITELNK